eukprot:gnl/TRDRNA2_/TRDRNA2_169344_c0_seq1.p1 gnl/TRDRNA2_/TRDRNA2_169344_c0~~gnl/TRDRNA2_/TRDRNA2_169344_c0_seq1.p1  ORF type:complete len:289 (+),score=33.10 gnl/TRDRNA2_/TRDRNA2_169344_c0_seq1:106-972(+)
MRSISAGQVGLRCGMGVCVHGLQNQPEFNGTQGVCESWDAKRECWVVRLPDGKVKGVRPENLTFPEVLGMPPGFASPEDPSPVVVNTVLGVTPEDHNGVLVKTVEAERSQQKRIPSPQPQPPVNVRSSSTPLLAQATRGRTPSPQVTVRSSSPMLTVRASSPLRSWTFPEAARRPASLPASPLPAQGRAVPQATMLSTLTPLSGRVVLSRSGSAPPLGSGVPPLRIGAPTPLRDRTPSPVPLTSRGLAYGMGLALLPARHRTPSPIISWVPQDARPLEWRSPSQLRVR